MSFKTEVKIWFKESVPKELTTYQEALQQFSDFIGSKTENNYHFCVYNIDTDLDDSLYFELYSTRFKHQEWQIQCVIEFIKERYKSVVVDFDINTEQTVEDLCFTIEDIEDEDN